MRRDPVLGIDQSSIYSIKKSGKSSVRQSMIAAVNGG